jgi:hypothetical protein
VDRPALIRPRSLGIIAIQETIFQPSGGGAPGAQSGDAEWGCCGADGDVAAEQGGGLFEVAGLEVSRQPGQGPHKAPPADKAGVKLCQAAPAAARLRWPSGRLAMKTLPVAFLALLRAILSLLVCNPMWVEALEGRSGVASQH